VVGIFFDSYNDKRTGFEFDLTAGRGQDRPRPRQRRRPSGTPTGTPSWDGKVAHRRQWAGTAEFRVAPRSASLRVPRTSRSGACTPGAGSPAITKRDPVAAHPASEHRAHVPAGRAARHPRPQPLAPPRGAAARVGSASSGPSNPGDGTDGAGSAGLDAKLGLSTNFTLDATLNPDFGQVEADPSVVNLDRLRDLLRGEAAVLPRGQEDPRLRLAGLRPALLLRAASAGPVLTPRRPRETVRMPEATTILGALKLTGKTSGGLSVAALQSLTQKEIAPRSRRASGTRPAAVSPSARYTVARVTRTGARQHEPGRHDHLHPSRSISTPRSPLPSQPSPGPPRLSRTTSPTAPGCVEAQRRPEPRVAATARRC
jgi:hypothetical protein